MKKKKRKRKRHNVYGVFMKHRWLNKTTHSSYASARRTIQACVYVLYGHEKDRFSTCLEAVPSAGQGSGTVIKFLTREEDGKFWKRFYLKMV